jgi:chemotaxis protein MotB
MKKTIHAIVFTALFTGLLLTSCGPGKKLMASRARVDKLQKDSINTHGQLEASNLQVKNLQDDKTSLQNENDSVQNDLKVLTSQSKMTIADQAKQLRNFQTIVQSQKNVMTNLKNSIANALMNYKTDDLFVFVKDGKVYVSLSEKLLFKSGSDVVDPKGKDALKSLAEVLNTTKDISVMIEGHTDNVPIKTKLFADNWDLSTARATSIVRILTNEYGFDSSRITASGRGKFQPVQTNETADGRASNRRTEIILSPDLKELYGLVYQ